MRAFLVAAMVALIGLLIAALVVLREIRDDARSEREACDPTSLANMKADLERMRAHTSDLLRDD